MDLITEINLRLSAYLAGNAQLEEFRIWFAQFLRTANRYDKSEQALIWSVDAALASFGSGRWSQPEFLKELKRLAYLQIGKRIEVNASASNVLREESVLRIERASG